MFVNYGNPAMVEGDKICPSSRRGVDAHRVASWLPGAWT